MVLYFSVPAIFSLIVEIMASVVDTAFAGHLRENSVDALTTMGLLSPVLNIYTAFQALFAFSTSIMIAKYLKDQTVREEYLITGLCMTFFVSIGVSVCSYLMMPKIFAVIGAEGSIALLAERYLTIQLFSNVFSALGYTLTSCIRAFGYPRIEMVLTGSAVLMNIVFNTIFVLGVDMGFEGLAYGTLVSELFCCFTSLAVCTAFFVNQSLMRHTTLNHVAVWNVVQKIYTLFLMPIVGIIQGVQTILLILKDMGRKGRSKQRCEQPLLIQYYMESSEQQSYIFSEKISCLYLQIREKSIHWEM